MNDTVALVAPLLAPAALLDGPLSNGLKHWPEVTLIVDPETKPHPWPATNSDVTLEELIHILRR